MAPVCRRPSAVSTLAPKAAKSVAVALRVGPYRRMTAPGERTGRRRLVDLEDLYLEYDHPLRALRLGERQLAAKYGVRGTPIIQFFSNKDDLAHMAPREREVNRIQGYMPPRNFLLMFAFVGERAYERGSLRDYLRRQS